MVLSLLEMKLLGMKFMGQELFSTRTERVRSSSLERQLGSGLGFGSGLRYLQYGCGVQDQISF
jgi:hypothetical protein